jgi:hypothetical protein
MGNNHVITKDIGNLRGFSTDSMFILPANVADKAINLQKAPDGTTQLRRGYQCQIGDTGGMGIGSFDNPDTGETNTVAIDYNGYLYNKLTKQIYFDYDGRVTGNITGASNALPCEITCAGHGLLTGTKVIIRNMQGMTNFNNKEYTITDTGVNTFELDGTDSTLYPAYTTGGYWSISFADHRYLTFSIFTDPRYINSNTGWSLQPWSFSFWSSSVAESITCNIIVNRACQVDGDQTSTNTINVALGHQFRAGGVALFNTVNFGLQQRNVTGVTTSTITIDGYPVTVTDLTYINKYYDILFGRGFDTLTPYLISDFLATIIPSSSAIAPLTGIYGLKVSMNGDYSYPAAFLQIVEPIIIDSNSTYSMDYWYWNMVNHTIDPPFPGSASQKNQNSEDFEIASFACYNNRIYIANGYDYPQKYDGQTVYRAGMPKGSLPDGTETVAPPILPFVAGESYKYMITYSQIDNLGLLVDGTMSQAWETKIVAANAAIDLSVDNIEPGTGWNTNGAVAIAGTATVYGPDSDGYYYNTVAVNPGYSLNVGDAAYYGDLECAVVNGLQVGVLTITVLIGHGVVAGDEAYFLDLTIFAGRNVLRSVTAVTPTSITIDGPSVIVAAGANILVYKRSNVSGNVAIVNGSQNNVTVITVVAGHSVQLNDMVSFVDANGRNQRRLAIAIGANTVEIGGNAVSVVDRSVIQAEEQTANEIILIRKNLNPAVLDNAPISNSLIINIYRTENNGDLFYRIASIPNNSDGSIAQIFLDTFYDVEIKRLEYYTSFNETPDPPPISKYVKTFGNQLLYGGGQRGNHEKSDLVYFSFGDFPESVSEARDFFSLPNDDDDVTGIGVSGSTLVITKNKSLWAVSGSLLTGQYEVTQIASGSNVGCVAHATIQAVGGLLYFLHTNGVYSMVESQLFPTDSFGNPVPLSRPIDSIFREEPYSTRAKFAFKRAVAINYTKDHQYLLFLPCENPNSSARTANQNSAILSYDYQGKNWYYWLNMNAAGGMIVFNDDLYFQERRYSGVVGNTANLYKQHRFYRLVDHADHAGALLAEWRSSWEDLGQPEVRKKFCRCLLLMDRISELGQLNNPKMFFSSYTNRIQNLQSTRVEVTPVDNIRNSSWSYSPWGWNSWSGYQDSFVSINLKQGTVAKSLQIGFTISGINMDIRLAGFQLEVIPENRSTIVR